VTAKRKLKQVDFQYDGKDLRGLRNDISLGSAGEQRQESNAVPGRWKIHRRRRGWKGAFLSPQKVGRRSPEKTVVVSMDAVGLTCCQDPSVPVRHTGRKMRAPWPAFARREREKKPAIPVKRHAGHKKRAPVGMTELEQTHPCKSQRRKATRALPDYRSLITDILRWVYALQIESA
jgi:hypothetical protein